MSKNVTTDHRAGLLESYWTFYYAKAMLECKDDIYRRFCQGCLIDTLSQRYHTCLTLTGEEKLRLYFEHSLREIDEWDIVRQWECAV